MRRALLQGTPAWVLPGASADLDFVHNRAWAGGSAGMASMISCSRASGGVAQTMSKAWINFPPNSPRITDVGLLSEQASTNLLLQSGNISNLVWLTAGQNPPVVSTNNIAPDGSATAIRATFSAAGSGAQASFRQAINVTNNQPVAIACYVKAAPSSSATNIRIATNNESAWNTGGDAVIALTSSWQRIVLTYQNTFGAGIAIFIGAQKADSSLDPTCYGDVLIWGATLEPNITYPTSYIATTTAAITRAADVVMLQGRALNAALTARAGRSVTNLGEGLGINQGVIFIANQSPFQSMWFPSSGPTAIGLYNGTNGVNAAIGNSGNYSGLVKAATGFDGASMTAIANGGTKATSANPWGTLGAPVYIGSNIGVQSLNGYLARLTFSPTKGQFDNFTANPGPL